MQATRATFFGFPPAVRGRYPDAQARAVDRWPTLRHRRDARHGFVGLPHRPLASPSDRPDPSTIEPQRAAQPGLERLLELTSFDAQEALALQGEGNVWLSVEWALSPSMIVLLRPSVTEAKATGACEGLL